MFESNYLRVGYSSFLTPKRVVVVVVVDVTIITVDDLLLLLNIQVDIHLDSLVQEIKKEQEVIITTKAIIIIIIIITTTTIIGTPLRQNPVRHP